MNVNLLRDVLRELVDDLCGRDVRSESSLLDLTNIIKIDRLAHELTEKNLAEKLNELVAALNGFGPAGESGLCDEPENFHDIRDVFITIADMLHLGPEETQKERLVVVKRIEEICTLLNEKALTRAHIISCGS